MHQVRQANQELYVTLPTSLYIKLWLRKFYNVSREAFHAGEWGPEGRSCEASHGTA